jgi:hypothetical protein
MGGKASLLLVLGFSSIFAIMGVEMLKSSNEATDNYVKYFEQTEAHNLAVSGANMAANEIFINKFWMAGYSNLKIDEGSLDVTVDSIGVENKLITAIGEYDGYQDTVIVLLAPKNFAQYGNFYNSMGAWAATGDTFSGPFHTNDYLKCYGDPVFLGYTTTQNGVKLFHNDGTDNPEFHGGLQEGLFIPLEFDTSIIRQAAYDGGKIFYDTTGNNYIIDTKFVLNNDGTVDYSSNINNAGWSPVINEPLTTLAPNGVIYVEKGNVFIEGTLNGQVSIVASTKGSTSAGMIHITDDLRYNKNPLSDPTSTDMLGLIAEKNVQVDFNLTTGNLDIHASMYSQQDGLVIEDYASYPTANNMNIIGGVIGQQVRATATYAWNGSAYVPTHGYSYVHKFDERFDKTVPPFFPKTKYYKVVTWLE